MLALLAAAFVAADAATKGADLSPQGVYFGNIAYGGTGCPQGTVSALFAPDRSSFTLLFDQYIASAGPGIPITQSRKACQVAAEIHVPQGWQFSVATVDYRGYIDLPYGASATQSTLFYFQGQQDQATAHSDFTGPIEGDYLITDDVGLETTIWSDCNAVLPFNVKSSARLSVPPGQSGQITTDSQDQKVSQIFGIQWRRC